MKLNTLTATIIVAVSLVLASGCSGNRSVKESGELGWPEVTRETKPWSRWWWPASAISNDEMDSLLQKYSEAGLGGMEVTTIYGAKGYEDQYRTYLSPEWMDLFTHTLDKAKSLDLGIDLANASGWPFGGNWVTPDYACRYLASKTYKVKSGEKISDKIEYMQEPILSTLGKKASFDNMKYPVAANDSLQQYAFEQVRYPMPLPLIAVTASSADGKFEDLTGKVGADWTLDWTAPEGDWTVCALFLGWHGKMVERAGPGGEGDVIDHFSGEAIDRYLAKFDEAFKGYDVSWIRYYFNDSYEVDDARGNSDWTEDFFDEFQARRGYDLRPYMPQLLGVADDMSLEERVVYDYRKTIGDLLLEKYSMGWQKWAAAQGKGIRNQAHGSPANIMDLYSVSDVPETEGREIVGMKTASSAAHVTDKPLTSSESATWLNEHFKSDLGDVKTSIDRYFLAGVNHIFYHGTCLSPESVPWPGWMFYAAVHFQPENSFWPDFAAFNSYVTRCQSFLQAGKPDNDLLLFFDATDLLSERGRNLLFHMGQNTPVESAIGTTATELYNKGYTWDFITDMMVSDYVSVSKGKIVTKEGSSYEAIVVPECKLMEISTFRKLVEMAQKGAKVIVVGGLPQDVPGLSKLDESRKELSELKEKAEKSGIVVTQDVSAALDAAGITRESMYDLGMQCISRVKPDGGRYYFLKNASEEAFEGWVPVDAVCSTIGVYDPMTGKYGYGKVKVGEDGKASVYMQIDPDQSYLLETFAGKYSGEEFSFWKASGESKAVEGKWTVKFTLGGPELPQTKEVEELGSWTAYGEPYEIFSGSAEYSIALPAMEAGGEAWTLDLGEVKHSAAVWVDGEYMGTVFKKPYAVVIPADKVSKGCELKVRVSNSMENRISWMDRTGQKWRILYNANIQARLREDRGEDGFFTAISWPVMDSGLLGPVTLTPVSKSE